MGKGKDIRPYKIPAPKDLKEYILRYCAETYYIVFSRKTDIAVCTCCGHEFHLNEVPLIGHEPDNKMQIHCPECGIAATPKDMRYGRKKLTDYGRITWICARKGVTFIETDKFIIDYKCQHPTVLLYPDQQIRLSKKSQERWDYYDGWWSAGEWHQLKTIRLKAKPSSWFIPSGWPNRSRWHDHLYDDTGVLKVGTDLRYINNDTTRFDDCSFDEFRMVKCIIQYLSDFLKYPAIEILEKAGFETLVSNRADGYKTRNINLRAKDLRKILKVNGAEVKKLRKMEWGGPSMSFLNSLHAVREQAPWAEIEDVNKLSRIMGSYIQEHKLQMIHAHTDMSKLLRKLLEDAKTKGGRVTLNDYADYLEALIALGRRLDKKALYPENFQEAHDQTINEMQEKKESCDAAIFKRFQLAITGMTEAFRDSSLGLLIRPANDPQELRNESQKLNHCVRVYIDKVSRGMTSILFIRKIDDPDTPYYTLELAPDGNVVQCRGDHNCGCTEKVEQFIAEWIAWREGLLKRQAAEALKGAAAPAA